MKKIILILISVTSLLIVGCHDNSGDVKPAKPVDGVNSPSGTTPNPPGDTTSQQQQEPPVPPKPKPHYKLDSLKESSYYIQQQVLQSFGNTIVGYYEALPGSYSASSNVMYPLLLFFPGAGERGDGSAEQLEKVIGVNGPAKYVHDNYFPKDFLVDGKYMSFVILSVQTKNGEWLAPEDMDQFLSYALEHYRIDTTRVYMTGLSMGGGRVEEFLFHPGYGKRIVAAVTMSGKSSPTDYRCRVMADARVHFWAFHCDGDVVVPSDISKAYVEGINTYAPGFAKLTLFPGNGHDSWSRGYNLNYREDGKNVYEWMLQFKRDGEIPTNP